MSVTYETTVIGDGNHASLLIPDSVLTELGTNRRAPLMVTINGHTYRSTATAVGGECRVVFPGRDRKAAGVESGDTITVTLELETGHREVDIPAELEASLREYGLREVFESMPYSHRKEYARAVAEAKTDETRTRRIVLAVQKIGTSKWAAGLESIETSVE